MSQFKWLSLIFLLILSLALVQGQGAGSDDSSSSDTQDAQDAPPPSDPNLLGPTNKQGYGRNVQTTLKKSETQAMKVSPSDATIGEQTIQAALQFGVLVGVALLVGILFMLNIGMELLFDAVIEKLSDMFGKKKVVDVENPAALVGTFKRYK